MECKEEENYLEKSGYSFLENSQLLYPDITNNNTENNNISPQKFHNHLRNYQNISKNNDNFNKKYHFNFTNDKIDEQNSNKEEENKKELNNSEKFLNYFLSNFFEIIYGRESSKKELNGLSSDVKIKKENFFLTKNSYIGFKNDIGDNSCYVNVVLHLLNNMLDINNILIDIAQIESMKKENHLKYLLNISNKNIINENELLSNLGEILIYV